MDVSCITKRLVSFTQNRPFPEAVVFLFQETEVFFNQQLTQSEIEFNQSKVRIHVNPAMDVLPAIRTALNAWHLERTVEKITPRVKKLSRQTGLPYQQLKFQEREKPWRKNPEKVNR